MAGPEEGSTIEPEGDGEEWYFRVQRNHPEIMKGPLWEVTLAVNGAVDWLGVERTWPDDLHPADVLNKHIFPQIAERLDADPADVPTPDSPNPEEAP